MKLYHFTCEDYIASILREGLTRGDIPLSPTTGGNAVWFTTSSSPEGHGLGSEGIEVITALTQHLFRTPAGDLCPIGTPIHRPDKSKIRITVVIRAQFNKRLMDWLTFAKKRRIERKWLSALHDDCRPETWWLHIAPVAPELFRAVEVRTMSGDYVPLFENLALLSDEIRAEIETLTAEARSAAEARAVDA